MIRFPQENPSDILSRGETWFPGFWTLRVGGWDTAGVSALCKCALMSVSPETLCWPTQGRSLQCVAWGWGRSRGLAVDEGCGRIWLSALFPTSPAHFGSVSLTLIEAPRAINSEPFPGECEALGSRGHGEPCLYPGVTKARVRLSL